MNIGSNADTLRKLSSHKPMITFVAGLAILVLLSLVFPESADTTGGLAMLIAYGGGAWIAFQKARGQQGRDRLMPIMTGIGLASAAHGAFIIAALETMGHSVPAFSPIDILFMLTYFGIIGGALTLPNAFKGPRDLARTIIDGVVGAVSIGTLLWVFVVSDIVQHFSTEASWGKWMGTAYPLLDILAIILFVSLLSRRSKYRLDPRLVLLTLGVVLQVVGDLIYLTNGAGSTFAAAEPKYFLFVGGATLFASGVYFSDYVPKPHEYADRAAYSLGVAAPYAVAAALATVTLVSLPSAGFDPVTRLLTGTALTAGTLIVIRQALAIHDTRIHLDRRRTDLVASISHELRTPLTAVVGFLELMNQTEFPLNQEETAEMAGLAHREAQRMSRIVADIVLLSGYTPRQMSLIEEELDVRELVDETIATLNTDGIVIEIEIDRGLNARLDKVRFQQVLVNLTENACRYGDERVLVVARNESGTLRLEVHDDGRGVPKQHQNVIWNSFERGAHRFNAAIPGTGIGLAVVAAVAAAHGGSSSYRDSDALGGACFTVEIPRQGSDVYESAPRTRSLHEAKPGNIQPGKSHAESNAIPALSGRGGLQPSKNAIHD